MEARPAWRPGRWCPHLLLAAARKKGRSKAPVVGFAYGFHLPDYGGCAAYLGIDPGYRNGGVATRLMRLLLRLLQVDAACEGVPLPFVILESRAPAPDGWRIRHVTE